MRTNNPTPQEYHLLCRKCGRDWWSEDGFEECACTFSTPQETMERVREGYDVLTDESLHRLLEKLRSIGCKFYEAPNDSHRKAQFQFEYAVKEWYKSEIASLCESQAKRIEELERNAKCGNIPYAEAVKIQEENKVLKSRVEQLEEALIRIKEGKTRCIYSDPQKCCCKVAEQALSQISDYLPPTNDD